MKLPIHSTDSAPEASRAILDGIAAELGFVPNLAATVAESPTLLTAFDALRRAVAGAGLEPTCREIAGLATGVAVHNAYGVAFHSTVLGRLGMADADIDRMRSGQPPTGGRSAAIYRLAQAIVTGRGKVDDAIVDEATAVGLTTTDVLDVTAECVFASLVGIVDNLADRVDLDAFLQPRAWAS
jgi:alkylhydroperoxidase family enzyme